MRSHATKQKAVARSFIRGFPPHAYRLARTRIRAMAGLLHATRAGVGSAGVAVNALFPQRFPHGHDVLERDVGLE